MGFDKIRSRLGAYLVERLDPISDADPELLTQYILILLKYDRSMTELYDMCLSKLKVFLGRDTESFVKRLFRHIDSEQSQGDGQRKRSRSPRGRDDSWKRHRSDNNIILVDRISPEHCTKASIEAFFQRFGTIEDVRVHPRHGRATVKYSKSSEALAAYHSPDPIFNNRFVRVHLQRNDESKPVEKKSQLLEFQKSAQELILKQIEQQKYWIQKLEQDRETKQLSDAEKQEIIQMLKSLQTSIDELRPSLKSKPQPNVGTGSPKADSLVLQ